MADTDRPFATQYILPMAGIRTGGTANRPAITTRGSLGLFPDDTRTAMPPLPQIGSGAYSRLAATQQPSPYVDAIMRRTRGMGALPAGGGLPTPPPAPKSPSLMDRLTPAMGTPAAAGLGAAAATGLQLSGYRPVPITTAEGLGAMMQAGMKSYTAEKKAQQAAELARQQRETDLAMKMMEIRAQQGRQATKEGLDVTRLRRDLRKDFDDSSKYFTEAKQFYTDVITYSQPEQSSAADIALVFSYMKMLDPDSVVREGEQLQVQGLGGLESQARSLLSRIGITQDGTHEGGRLIIDPVIRAQIRQAAADRYATLTLGQLDLEEFTGSEGSMAGLTPDFFRSKLSGDGSMKRPYIVRSYDDLPEKAKTGDYAIVNGVFEKIEVQ